MDDEYIITNQLGGYTSSTFHHGNTRKYHGLLITSDFELKRKVIISTLAENIIYNGNDISLNIFRFLPDIHLQNKEIQLQNAKTDGILVCLEYLFELGKLTKEINLMQEENTVEVRYKFILDKEITFEVAPFLANRDIHKLQVFSEDTHYKTTNYLNKYQIVLSPIEKLEILIMSFNANKLINLDYIVKSDQIIYKNFYYPKEKERGFDASEDLLRLMTLGFCLKPGENYINIRFKYVNLEIRIIPKRQDALRINTVNYFFNSSDRVHKNSLGNFKKFLIQKGEDFLIDFGNIKSIVAGFHWFGDWGRDTFISFRGLLLTTKKFSFAKDVLNYWVKAIKKNGFIPNDLHAKNYRSIDASLWLIIAIYYYYIHTKDLDYIQRIFPLLEKIMKSYSDGDENLSIKLSKENFLIWENEKFGLSWMDSMVNKKSTTHRIGAAVEVQFLWFNCFKIYSLFEKLLKIKNKDKKLKKTFLGFKKVFVEKFLNKEKNYLFDYILGPEKSDQIRPNVIIGLSLPFQLLGSTEEKILLKTAEEKLLNEFGLYSLDPNDSEFIPGYSGDSHQRDKAYHNGAIWPYLLGMYLKAYLRVYNYSQEAKEYVFQKLNMLNIALEKKGLNYLPEIFAAGDKHPDGCLTQAWNYATLLEVIYDFENNK